MTQSVVGIIRCADVGRRQHRVALGRVPAGRAPWELGAAAGRDPGDGIGLWTDEDGRLESSEHPPGSLAPRPAVVARWVLAPLAWADAGRIRYRLRAVARRVLDVAGIAVNRRFRAEGGRDVQRPSPQPVAAWLYRSGADDRWPLFVAVHPVTRDQLVTRDPSEPQELGYGTPSLLGYAVRAAPVTGSLTRPTYAVPWSSRYGLAVTGGQDPYAADEAEKARSAGAGAADRPAAIPMLFAPGHFYSPLVDPAEVSARRSAIWPAEPRKALGIDWRDDAQRRLCAEGFAAQEPLAFRSDEGDDPTEYWAGNDQFPPLDAWVLGAMLRHYEPARMIEIGSGFSSLVAASVNRSFLGGSMRFTCVEPYPRQFLIDGVDGISELRVERVQETPLELFEELGPGDVLFVDTSHTVKTGNDVVWIFEEVFPRLAPGVLVHVHDVFLPRDYPETWVLEGRGWNEQYLIRAFLSYNDSFEIVFGVRYMISVHPGSLQQAFPGWEPGRGDGGSLWFRRAR